MWMLQRVRFIPKAVIGAGVGVRYGMSTIIKREEVHCGTGGGCDSVTVTERVSSVECRADRPPDFLPACYSTPVYQRGEVANTSENS